MWAAIINIIIGLFLMIAPAIFHFEKAVADQYHIVAPVVITCAVISLWEINRSAHYINIIPGLWFIVAPFIFHFQPASAKWIAVVSGMVILLLSLLKRKVKGKYGGGWRSLFQKHPVHM